MNKKFALAFLATLLLLPALRTFADDKPTIEATDQKTIAANLDKDVIITGTVASAHWSPKGNVLFISFKGNKAGDFEAIAKKENRETLDKAFDGDIAKALAKTQLKITGKISTFKAKGGTDALQLEIKSPDQIEIVKETATKPAN